MITETGDNLHVLIVTEIDQDWQAFATWYSVYKNIPNATVEIACVRNRNKTTPFQCFQWCKRLSVPIFYTTPHLDEYMTRLSLIPSSVLCKTVLIMPSLTMFVDVLDQKLINEANSNESFFWSDKNIWIFKGLTRETICNDPSPREIVKEAKETEDLWSLVDCQKGCGKWIPSLRGCPLSNAGGLISEEMTVNENRIIELWKRMVALYSAVAY